MTAKPTPHPPRRHTPLTQTIPATAARLTDVPARPVKATFNSAV